MIEAVILSMVLTAPVCEGGVCRVVPQLLIRQPVRRTVEVAVKATAKVVKRTAVRVGKRGVERRQARRARRGRR